MAENTLSNPLKSEVLADFIVNTRTEVIPGDIRFKTVRHILDSVGAGMSGNQLTSTRNFKNLAAAKDMQYRDVNNDGIMDVVFTFDSKELSKGAVPGAKMDLWLYTQVNGHRVVGYDVVPVETETVKVTKTK